MNSTKSRYKVAIIAPTCFYYQSALFRELAGSPRIDLTIYFCSDENLSAQDALEMYKSDEAWGVGDELLEGYKFIFLKNLPPLPSYFKWPVGLVDIGT